MLPAMTTEPPKRWTAQRDLLAEIDRGEITVAEACRRYNMTLDELAAWRDGHGLLTTKSQSVRRGRAYLILASSSQSKG